MHGDGIKYHIGILANILHVTDKTIDFAGCQLVFA